ncbi:MAG: hypothetical protein EOP04_00240 [Proteobacteria bacterium]|nr:MAG: hypothetical protein EOP04_00240 [Pseudomonadota bacterium]
MNDPLIKNFLGQLVRFTVGDNGNFTVEGVDQISDIQSKAETYWRERRKPLATPMADLTVDTIKVWNQSGVKADDIRSYGAKATNFSILDKALTDASIDRTRYNNGFMVPFSFYDKHMSTEITADICQSTSKKCSSDLGHSCGNASQLCNNVRSASRDGKATLKMYTAAAFEAENRKKMYEDPLHRREFLTFIQRLIREAPLSTEVSAPIQKAMETYHKTTRMRLRSSTNAEDIVGLNGAGLYESKSACLGDGEKAKDDDGKLSACRTSFEAERMRLQVEKLRSLPDNDGKFKALADNINQDITKKYPLSKAVRSVYASLWTERAFLTREFYSLDHLKISMGMLSHPSFVDESANGVAVVDFKNGVADGIKIEAQYDDISVTNPIFPDAIPELWSGAVGDGKLSDTKMVQASTMSTSGRTVLSQKELEELTRQLVIAASAIRSSRGGERYDLEFILGKEREILVKQGRPL